MNQAKEHLSRLKNAQQALDMSSRQLAGELRVSEFWLSKVFNGHKPASEDLMLRLDDLLRRRNLALSANLNLGGLAGAAVDEPRASYEAVASRIPLDRRMPTRADCEDLLQQVLDAAEAEGSPENMPVIYHRLKKRFPLDEWEPASPQKET